MPENFDTEVAHSIRSLFELTSRIDERVKSTAETSDRTEHKIEEVVRIQNEMISRISVLEKTANGGNKETIDKLNTTVGDLDKRITGLEIGIAKSRTIWDKVTDYIMKILVAIAAAYFMWKFGF